MIYKKILTVVVVTFLILSNIISTQIASADTISTIVISEIAWAGSETSGSDEWFELFNNTSSDISLSGYKLEDDGTIVFEFGEIVIHANSYFLVEKREDATSIDSDVLISNLSLANSGDSLRLLNDNNEVVDSVNTSGAWFAGSSSNHATMSRIDLTVSGDIASNWGTSEGGNGAVDSGGIVIVGTPKSDNSSGTVVSGDTDISLYITNGNQANGDIVEIEIKYRGDEGLFSYGFVLNYDDELLEFSDAIQEDFLSEDGDIETTFQSELEDHKEGKLIVAESRLQDEKEGTSDTKGVLAKLKFKILGNSGDDINLEFDNDSFAAGVTQDFSTNFIDLKFTVSISTLDNVDNLNIVLGSSRYSFELSWDDVNQAETYKIERKNGYGVYEEIANITETNYIDDNNIVPFQSYEYRIFAVAGDVISTGSTISIEETRGIIGDFDRSDRVDGRDLEMLAKVWLNSLENDNFNPVVDSNLDGNIDSLDLFNLGAHFGEIYEL